MKIVFSWTIYWLIIRYMGHVTWRIGPILTIPNLRKYLTELWKGLFTIPFSKKLIGELSINALKCHSLHEIEQIAMRSVCLEMSSNMFMIFSLGLKSIIFLGHKKLLSQKKIRSLRGVENLCLVQLSRRQRGARGCLQNKKNLAYSNNNRFVRIITSVRTVVS